MAVRPSVRFVDHIIPSAEGSTDSPLVVCSRRGCTFPVVNDGAWAGGEPRESCARHRQLARLRDGLCPNCGGFMEERPIINALTGRPRASVGVPRTRRECGACGYALRATR